MSQAKQAWLAAQPLLQRAMSKLKKQAMGKSRLASFDLRQRHSLSRAKKNMKVVEGYRCFVGKKETSIPRAIERQPGCF